MSLGTFLSAVSHKDEAKFMVFYLSSRFDFSDISFTFSWIT